VDITRNDIMHYLINSLLLGRLELADAGYGPADFCEDTALLSNDGLNLDSVDALDLLVGIEKKYQLEPIEINGDFIEENCATIARVIDMVQARMMVPA
jgi:acyl carrier protein